MSLKSCSSDETRSTGSPDDLDEIGSTGWAAESSDFGGLVSSEDVIPEIKFIPHYYFHNINKTVAKKWFD